MVDAKNPLRLTMADTQPMKGGKKQVSVELFFTGFDEDTGRVVDVRTPITLYEANINDDVVLSYTLLGVRIFDAFPKLHGVKGHVGTPRVWVPGTSSELVARVSSGPEISDDVELPEGQAKAKALCLSSGEGVVSEVLTRQDFLVTRFSVNPLKKPSDFENGMVELSGPANSADFF